MAQVGGHNNVQIVRGSHGSQYRCESCGMTTPKISDMESFTCTAK